MSKKYLTVAETSAMARKSLAEAFPGIKFSVRSKSYSGGASMDVYWTDGPTSAQVDAITGRFSGASFDGMTDSKSYTTATVAGEQVHFGADYVFTHRAFSDELVSRAIAALLNGKYAGNFRDMTLDQRALITVENYRYGRLYALQVPYMNTDVQAMLQADLSKRTRIANPKFSATAEQVAA